MFNEIKARIPALTDLIVLAVYFRNAMLFNRTIEMTSPELRPLHL
jgi:hypothetical protein